eukprot:TRINITY_DN460_c0_g1_i4.p3 TRINITY_DN460_c0_g1~~TRINITY_DN460_c0_g1_i4.p3  ORF type:complete len:147 (+),score=58.85 TRINITY_DN460_c0_g1_i4:65-442(+)
MALRAAMTLCLLLVVGTSALDLTADDFDAKVFESGKSGFVKFFAPWCGHCKRMKPAWDKLMDEFADHSKVVVADVDCTQHRDLCGRFEVRGFPTVKFFAPGDKTGEKYAGGRDFDSLKAHVESKL